MAKFDQDSGNSNIVGSTLWWAVNPFASLSTQFTSIFSLPVWAGMKRGRLTYGLMYNVDLLTGGLLKNIFKPGTKARDISDFLLGKTYTGFEKLITDMGYSELYGSEKVARMARIFEKAFAKGQLKSFEDVTYLLKASNAYSLDLKMLKLTPAKLATASKQYKTMALISRVGRIGQVLTVGTLVGETLANAASLAFKGTLAATQFMKATADSMRALEFGGQLSAGFMSFGAATERQRAIQEIQRSHLSGRRFMGNEASIMAGML